VLFAGFAVKPVSGGFSVRGYVLRPAVIKPTGGGFELCQASLLVSRQWIDTPCYFL
jgi:hypothetical protein